MTRRKTRRGNTAAKPPLYGIGAFDSNVYAIAGNPAGTDGNVGGFWAANIFRVSTLSDGLLLWIWSGSASAWSIRLLTGNIIFSAWDGVSAHTQSPYYTTTVANAVYGAVGVYDGAKVRLYMQGIELGDGTATPGYSAAASAMYIGAAGAAGNYIDWFGSAYGTGVPTAQNIADWWTRTKSARGIQDMPGASPATRLWRPGSALGNVTDLVGGKVLQMGAPQDQVLRVVSTPNWG